MNKNVRDIHNRCCIGTLGIQLDVDKFAEELTKAVAKYVIQTWIDDPDINPIPHYGQTLKHFGAS